MKRIVKWTVNKVLLPGLGIALLLMQSSSALGDVITQWNFNSIVPDAATNTGSLIPNIGTSIVPSAVGTTTSFASGAGSSDPLVGDDSAWNLATFAAQGTGNKSRGAFFAVNTTGFENITVSFDQRLSNTAANSWRFQFSTDGSTFTDSTLFTFTPLASGTGETWMNGRSVDLSAVAGVANNSLFAFRIVAEFDPVAGQYVAAALGSSYGTTGTSRFDMVTINGDLISAVPEPSSMALVGLVVLGSTWFRRRR